MPLVIGAIVGQRYRIDASAGVGGFGEVYRATDLTLGAAVAVKTIHVGRAPSAETRAARAIALLDEARNLSRLRHPNIVAALDAGLIEQDGGSVPYLVVEWMEGPTLAKYLADPPGPRSLAATWAILQPIVSGLAHAHGIGIAHRDLKPSNVMMDEVGGAVVPRLIDFGIAKSVEAGDMPGSGATRTSSDSSPFTPAYAAPEQVVAARTGPWTDVHALGLLFVEICTGRDPYGDVWSGVAISPERPTPAAFGVDVGPFEPVIARALALRPRERYPDARAMLAALGAAAASIGLAAGSPDTVPPGPIITVRSLPPPGEDAPISATVPSARAAPGTRGVERAIERARLALPQARMSRRAILIGGGAVAAVVAGAVGTGTYFWLEDRALPPGPKVLAGLDAAEIEVRLRRAFRGVTEVEPLTRSESLTPEADEVTVDWGNVAGHVLLCRLGGAVSEARLTARLRVEREAETFRGFGVGYAAQGGTFLWIRARDPGLISTALDALCSGIAVARRSDGRAGAPPFEGI